MDAGNCCEVTTCTYQQGGNRDDESHSSWEGKDGSYVSDLANCWLCKTAGYNSPIILDVFGSGYPDLLVSGAWKKGRRWAGYFTGARRFDLDGSGQLKWWEWVGPKAGLLVYGEGSTPPTKITGINLFGTATFGKEWKNGYEPLATLDTDGDGKIAGEELRKLWVWLDANTNAVPDEGEVKPASDYISEMPLKHETDPEGNAWQEASVPLKDGRKVRSWDWWSANPDVFYINGKRRQPLALRGLGKPLPRLTVYYWTSSKIGGEDGGRAEVGLLRFVKAGADLYVISAGIGKAMVYSKVSRDGESYSWDFESYLGGVSDKNTATPDGEYLLGAGVFRSDIRLAAHLNGDYIWTAELAGENPHEFLPAKMAEVYEALISFSDEDFGSAVSTFPTRGVFEPLTPVTWPGLLGATVPLQDLARQ